MNDTKASITTFQYGVFIVGALIANGIFSLPRSVSLDGGRTGWIMIVLVGIVTFLVAALAHQLASRHPDEDPADWSLKLLGPVLGRLWLLLYVVKSGFFAVLTAKIYAGVVSNRVLLTTPNSVIAGIIIILSVMAVLTKLGGLARFSEISVLAWVPILSLIVFTISRTNLVLLRPLFGDAALGGLLTAARQASYSFAGFDILLFAYPHLQRRKGSFPAIAWGMLFVTGVYVVTTIAAITFLGLEQNNRTLVPTLVLFSIAETSVIERFDSLALFLWMGMEVITAATQLYMGTRAMQGLLKGVSYHKAAAALGAFLFVVGWGDTPLRVVVLISDIFGLFDLSFVTGSIILLYILTLVRERMKRNAPT